MFCSSPSLFVQRWNGTTAGLGYLEVVRIVHANFTLGRLANAVFALSIPTGGEWIKPDTDFIPQPQTQKRSS
jgi:hypothetical protein